MLIPFKTGPHEMSYHISCLLFLWSIPTGPKSDTPIRARGDQIILQNPPQIVTFRYPIFKTHIIILLIISICPIKTYHIHCESSPLSRLHTLPGLLWLTQFTLISPHHRPGEIDHIDGDPIPPHGLLPASTYQTTTRDTKQSHSAHVGRYDIDQLSSEGILTLWLFLYPFFQNYIFHIAFQYTYLLILMSRENRFLVFGNLDRGDIPVPNWDQFEHSGIFHMVINLKGVATIEYDDISSKGFHLGDRPIWFERYGMDQIFAWDFPNLHPTISVTKCQPIFCHLGHDIYIFRDLPFQIFDRIEAWKGANLDHFLRIC